MEILLLELQLARFKYNSYFYMLILIMKTDKMNDFIFLRFLSCGNPILLSSQEGHKILLFTFSWLATDLVVFAHDGWSPVRRIIRVTIRLSLLNGFGPQLRFCYCLS